jgi:hypothetical protein
MPYVSQYRATHESFPQPEDGSIKIWRYLDLPRLVALLMRNQLPLTRVDLLKDEFEGSVTKGVYEAWKVNPRNAEMFARARPQFKRMVYVSCWHANNGESEAMWRLYCGEREGIALRTSYETLDRLLPTAAFLGKVTYVDYKSDGRLPADANVLTPFMYKRQAFEHEHEVRVAVWLHAMLIALGKTPDQFPSDEPETIGLDWNIDQAIENVFVSPYAPEWYRDVIVGVLEKFAPALVSRLLWSNLKGVPLY